MSAMDFWEIETMRILRAHLKDNFDESCSVIWSDTSVRLHYAGEFNCEDNLVDIREHFRRKYGN
jgi:hypothetical protein